MIPSAVCPAGGHPGRQHVIILIEKDGINCFFWESWIIIRHYMLHKHCTHTIQKIWLQTIYCNGYWILNWPPDGVNDEEVEDDEEAERQEVDEDEEGGVVDVVQRLRPDSTHVNHDWRCFEASWLLLDILQLAISGRGYKRYLHFSNGY